MRIRKIYYTNNFIRKIETIPGPLRRAARAREQLFKHNCFDPTLKTHPYYGERNRQAFWITHTHVIIFKFVEEDKVAFIDLIHSSMIMPGL